VEESPTAAFRQQLESLYSISIETSRLHELPPGAVLVSLRYSDDTLRPKRSRIA